MGLGSTPPALETEGERGLTFAGMGQVDISEDLIGQTYGELFARLTLTAASNTSGAVQKVQPLSHHCFLSDLPSL